MKLSKYSLLLTPLLLLSLGAFEMLPEAIIYKDKVSQSEWLWNDEKPVEDGAKSYFRLTIEIPEEVKKAFLNVYYDDSGKLFVNGNLTAISNFAASLQPGKNILAFELQNGRSASGLLFYGEIQFASGRTLALHSNQNVKASSMVPIAWNAPDFNDSTWPPAREQGDVLAYPWARHINYVENFTTPSEKAKIKNDIIVASTLPSGLEKEPAPEAKIIYQGSQPKISINGQLYEPILNLCGAGNPYYDNIALKTNRLGVKLFQIGIQDVDFYRSSGNYDFSRLDSQARRLLHLNSDAKLFISFRYASMQKWCEENPDEVMEFAAGPIEADCRDERTGRPLRPSAASEKFQSEVELSIHAFTEYVKKQPWGKRVVGIRVCYGIYCEWHSYGMYMGPDTSTAMTAVFQRYLKNKYPTEEALQRAWNDPEVTFASATVPTQEKRMNPKGFLLDPLKNRHALDYYDCHASVMADLLLFMAKIVKENLPGRLCGAYYGYVFSNHPPEGANILLDKVLQSPYIDFLSDPPTYSSFSRQAGGDNAHRTVPATYRRYGKLSIIEDDSRFHHLASYTESYATRNAHESRMTMRRNFCNNIFDGCGIQLADPIAKAGTRPHAFDDPDVLKALQESMKAVEKAGEISAISGNDTAVVVHYLERLRRDGIPWGNSLTSKLYGNTLQFLNRSGIAFDLMTLYDFIETKQQYKTVLFLNAFSLSDTERIAVKTKIRRPGATAIWLIAPGSVTEKGFSDAAMQELTGIQLAGAGIMAEVHCVDPDAQPLKFAASKKTLADGSRVIFIPNPLNSGTEWQEIFKQAGSHIFTAPESYFRNHDQVFMLHTGLPGKHVIQLPEKNHNITELFSGQKFAGSVITLETDSPETWLFKKEK